MTIADRLFDAAAEIRIDCSDEIEGDQMIQACLAVMEATRMSLDLWPLYPGNDLSRKIKIRDTLFFMRALASIMGELQTSMITHLAALGVSLEDDKPSVCRAAEALAGDNAERCR
jgi:hypothetical protein